MVCQKRYPLGVDQDPVKGVIPDSEVASAFWTPIVHYCDGLRDEIQESADTAVSWTVQSVLLRHGPLSGRDKIRPNA